MNVRPRILILLILAFSVLTLTAQHFFIGGATFHRSFVDDNDIPSDSLLIEGRVVESMAKRGLSRAFMIPVGPDGSKGDTIRAYPRIDYVSFSNTKTAYYLQFLTARKDSTYTFEIGCPGYLPQTVVYKVERVGKRESKRELPLTVLEREPYQLKEVEVVASKVKFYHNGDTLVYNADAFQLAEGSMLDELIRQLPGVELNDKGEIKVNGEKVETLLLNGKHFFSGNNNLMLENLGAYTVKNVKVYRGQTAVEKWVGDPNAKKHLTMDVRLKKEYSMGYILNMQTGYGTEERYMGNLFSSWFSNTLNLSLVGNLNNVGDFFGLHGAEDSWRPSPTSSGDTQNRSAGLNYDIETSDFNRSAHGSFTYSGDRNMYVNDGSSATYYTDNQVFGYNYSRNRNRMMNLNTSHNMMFLFDRVNLSADISGFIRNSDSKSSSLSASFNQEQADMTKEILETIYGDGSATALAALINRNSSISNSDSKSAGGNITTTARYKVPGTSDVITLAVKGTYSSSRRESWNDYVIDFGDMTKPSDKRRQYTDGSPNHNLTLDGSCTYMARIGNVSLDVSYRYSYTDSKAKSYLYELQHVADMGEYGVLPPDYQSAFSPANSYLSTERNNTHVFAPNLRYELKCKGNRSLSLNISPGLTFVGRRLHYWRNNHWYNIRRNASIKEALTGNISITFQPSAVMSQSGSSYSLSYQFNMSSQLPSLMSLIDITDDSNPLFIREGNPDLKASYSYFHSFGWRFGRKVFQNIMLTYSYFTNSMTQASSYDMKTGITRSRTENINGNNMIMLSDWMHWSFGKTAQFMLSSNTSISRSHDVDLMSTNGAEPVKNSANTWSIGEVLSINWRIGSRYNIGLRCDALNRRTNSKREGFNKINAYHINYGLDGRVQLPAGFEIGTNFALYTRHGYGTKEHNTTDALWNAQASYITKNRKWVFMVYAYDILHQVSNVHYNVTATGRSVSYTNSLPRYVMATVQFRFNHQPKKRM